MFLKQLARHAFLVSLILGCSTLTGAQGFSVETKNPPSATAKITGTFTSLDGRFSVALPQQISGFSPVVFETRQGRITAGDSYSWEMAGAQYAVTYVDKSNTPYALLDVTEVVRALSEGAIKDAAAQGGKVLSDGAVTVSGHTGREVRLALPKEYRVSRVVAAGERVYQFEATFKKDARILAAANKVLDSFKVLSAAEAEAAMRKKVAEAAPDPLPQEPVAARPRSDAEDEGLKGRVKTVFTEAQDLSGTWTVQGRKPSSMEYYNERGNLTKRETYDYKGNPADITVYGYLDGERVSLTEDIEREYNPPPVIIVTAPGKAKPRYDPRYSYKYKFKYDSGGRLLEEALYMSSGEPYLRYVYKYTGNQKEKLVYEDDGSLNQKTLYTLDDKGNELEEVVYEAKDNSVRSKESYSYEFDAQGNWTARITSEWGVKDGKEGYRPSSLHYRTITYY